MEDNKHHQRELKTQQNKFWLQTQVNDILEPMMLAVCQEDPADKVSKTSNQQFIKIIEQLLLIIDRLHAQIYGKEVWRESHMRRQRKPLKHEK